MFASRFENSSFGIEYFLACFAEGGEISHRNPWSILSPLFWCVLVSMLSDESPNLGNVEFAMTGIEVMCDDLSSPNQGARHSSRRADEAI